MRTKRPSVYLLASERNGTLYLGVTSDLVKRIWQHRTGATEGFSSRYGVHRLVWYETHAGMQAAIAREKALKCWKRVWKVDQIEHANPQWRDLYEEIAGC